MREDLGTVSWAPCGLEKALFFHLDWKGGEKTVTSDQGSQGLQDKQMECN